MNAVARDIEYAANHIRTANHSTMRGALTVPQTYEAVGNLVELVQRLPQVLDFLSRSVYRADPAEHFLDSGRHPSEALNFAHGRLDDTHTAITNAIRHLNATHNHLGHLGHLTPED